MRYLAVDGDDVGRKIERMLLENRTQEARSFSRAVENDLATLRTYLEENGAEVVFCAGDSLLACFAEDGDVAVDQLPEPKATTWSIGIGPEASQAALALKRAKGLGRNRVETIETK